MSTRGPCGAKLCAAKSFKLVNFNCIDVINPDRNSNTDDALNKVSIMNCGCTDNFKETYVDKLDYFYKLKNICHSGWVDSKWHNNKEIHNIDY
jgi:hypothetical protein